MELKAIAKVAALMICGFYLATNAQAQGGQVIKADYGAGQRRIDVTQRVQSFIQNGSLNFQVSNEVLGGDPAPGQPKELRLRVRNWNGSTNDYRFAEKQTVSLQLGGGGRPPFPGGGNGQYQGVLAPEWQRKFDSYYTRWLDYKRTNNREEIASMEKRMRDIMYHYQIPLTVQFSQVASPGLGGPGNYPGGPNPGYGNLQIVQATYGSGGRTMNVTSRLQGMVTNGSLSVRVDNDSMGGDPAPGMPKQLLVVYMYQGQRRNLTVREKGDLRLP